MLTKKNKSEQARRYRFVYLNSRAKLEANSTF